MRTIIIICGALALAVTAASAENLDVSVVTVKKFIVQDNGGVRIPSGKDSHWDFLEITNTDDSPLPVVITGVNADGIEWPDLPGTSPIVRQDCVLTGGTQVPAHAAVQINARIHHSPGVRYFRDGDRP